MELTAKSMDEAKKTAAEKLGVGIDNVQITVLEETKGLFGKMNLRVKAEALESVGGSSSAAVVEAPVQEPKPEAKKPARGRAKKAAEPAAEPLEAIQEAMDAPPPAEVAVAEAPESDEPVAEINASEEDAANFKKLLDTLMDSGDLDVTSVTSLTGGRYVNIALDGKDVAHLVGKHGEVLNALQYLVNIMASRRFGNGVRATLDGNDFRRRREEALTNLAVKIAEQVKARHEEAVLDALPAFERRVVHKALSTISGVSTYSEGEEPNRRVVIAPEE
jgi:spoIIIJ-associated protein